MSPVRRRGGPAAAAGAALSVFQRAAAGRRRRGAGGADRCTRYHRHAGDAVELAAVLEAGWTGASPVQGAVRW